MATNINKKKKSDNGGAGRGHHCLVIILFEIKLTLNAQKGKKKTIGLPREIKVQYAKWRNHC